MYNINKITIIAFLRAYPPHTGGAQKIARELYVDLDSSETEVCVITNVKNCPSKKLFFDESIKVLPIRFPKTSARIVSRRFLWKLIDNISLIFRLRGIINKNTCFHIHWIEDLNAFGLFFRVFKNPIIYTCHGPVDANKLKKWIRKEKKCIPNLKKVVFVSQSLFNSTLTPNRNYSFDYQIISNGVNEVTSFQSEPSKSEFIQFVFTGRIIPLKGIHHLVEIFNVAINQLQYNAKLTLVGDGSEEYLDQLKEKITAYNLDTKILFTGRQEVDSYYQSSDVFISASSKEGMPLSPLEAMSYGLIPLLSKIPPHQEMIESFNPHWLFDPEAYNQSAQLLSTINKEMVKNNRLLLQKYKRDHFSKQKMVSAYQNLFNTLSQC